MTPRRQRSSTLREALGDIPLIGFFAGGEIARHHLYGYTGVLTVPDRPERTYMTRAVADERHILSAAGVAVPQLIYGTAWKKERTAELVAQALRAGFRGIDTACQPKHYHEPGVGEALAVVAREGVLRSDIFLQTKFSPLRGQDPDNVPYDPSASIDQQVQQSFAVSLRNLGVDTLDSLILHSPYSEDSDTLEAWGAMERLFDQGLVRQLGISNCYEPKRFERLWRAARIKPAALQNRFYAKTHYDRGSGFFAATKTLFIKVSGP